MGSRHTPGPKTLLAGAPSSSQEVETPSSTRTSSFGSAASADPARARRGEHIRRSAASRKPAAARRSSEEHHRERERRPAPKPPPTPPSPPWRRRPRTYLALHYVQAWIYGFPSLPPPRRPTEAEEPADLRRARWAGELFSEIASPATVTREGRVQVASDSFLEKCNFKQFWIQASWTSQVVWSRLLIMRREAVREHMLIK